MPTDNNNPEQPKTPPVIDFSVPVGATTLMVNKGNGILLIDWLSSDSVIESIEVNPQVPVALRLLRHRQQRDSKYIFWLFEVTRKWDYAENPTEERRVWKVDRNG